MYDVIIIGAGPAGSITAKNLAEKGLKTLIIEKCKLPRYKSCSGVLIKKSKELIEKNVGQIPDTVTCTPVNTRGIIIKNEFEKEFKFEDDGINVWRDRFDYWLTKQACDRGAELLESTSVTDFIEQKDSVSLRIKSGEKYDTITGRIIVACDGVNGISRKKLNTIEPKRIVTYQAFYYGSGNFDPHYFYAFLNNELSEYDAWVNTKDNRLAIGVGVKKAGNAPVYFNRFINYLYNEYHLNLKEKLIEEFWTIPLIIPDFQTVLNKGRVFFTGEAAGFINPLGEGISIALVSGIALSKAIAKDYIDSPVLNEHQILENYQNEMKYEIEHMKRQWVLLHQLSPSFWEKLETSSLVQSVVSI